MRILSIESINLNKQIRNFVNLSLPSTISFIMYTYFGNKFYKLSEHATIVIDIVIAIAITVMSILLIIIYQLLLLHAQQQNQFVEFTYYQYANIFDYLKMTEADEDYQIQDDEDYEENNQEYDESVSKKIARIPAHQSFDASSFTQSKSGVELSKYISRGFPISNAPTLQVSPESKLNFLGSQNNPKASYQMKKNLNQFNQFSRADDPDDELSSVKKQLKNRQILLDHYVAKIQELNESNLNLEKIVRQKDFKIRQKQQLILMQQKKFREMLQNPDKNINIKNINIKSQQKEANGASYLQDFCPQFLSPEQSLQLYTQLLLKIEKSASLKKKIAKEKKLMAIMGQILKLQ